MDHGTTRPRWHEQTHHVCHNNGVFRVKPEGAEQQRDREDQQIRLSLGASAFNPIKINNQFVSLAKDQMMLRGGVFLVSFPFIN